MGGPDFQDIGDRMTRALISGDFSAYRDLMGLPLTISPREGRSYVLSGLSELREDFDLYHSVIHRQGVTDIFRQIRSQEDLGAGRWRFDCLTHLMARAHRLVDPFSTTFLLERRPEGWRIIEIESSEGHITWTLGRTEISPDGRFGDGEGSADAED